MVGVRVGRVCADELNPGRVAGAANGPEEGSTGSTVRLDIDMEHPPQLYVAACVGVHSRSTSTPHILPADGASRHAGCRSDLPPMRGWL